MTSPSNATSIKSAVILLVVGLSVLALVAMSGLMMVRYVNISKQNNQQDAASLTQVLAQVSGSYIIADNKSGMVDVLNQLERFGYVDHVHIYSFDYDKNLAIFATYNRPSTGAVEWIIREGNKVRPHNGNLSGLEFIAPIEENGRLGYVYLISREQNTLGLISEFLLPAMLVFVIIVALSLAFVMRLQGRFLRPIQDITQFATDMSLNKDTQQRAASGDFKETILLAEAFNRLLVRLEERRQTELHTEQQHKRLTSSLEEKVAKRTQALKDSNEELIKTLEQLHQFQRQLVEKEKLASLGDMVAGVAQEVNVPISNCLSACNLLDEKLSRLDDDFNTKQLRARNMERFLQDSQNCLQTIRHNLDRSAELISGFKQVAVNQTDENTRMFPLRKLIEELLITLRPRLKNTHHDVYIECDDKLQIESKAGPLNQILYNLLTNSLEHAFAHSDNGHIFIVVTESQHAISILYRDDGIGIPEHLGKRIFDPFVTTKRGNGRTGMGLHLVYNLVTQILGGTIQLVQDGQPGSEFVITFPVSRIEHNRLSAG